jgi:hypothetical protein
MAFAAAFAATITALTLPSAGNTPAQAAILRPVPAADQLDQVAVSDDMYLFHPLKIVAPVRTSWKVSSGDTLSGIAKARYGRENAWPLVYWANRKQVRWANRIQVGQILDLPIPDGPIPAAPRLLEPPPPPPPAPVHVTMTSSSGFSTARNYHSTYTAASGTYHGSGGMQACIIARESGGNSQVMNSSGHYGLYQFSASTWAASGGSSADFGHASVAEQNRVFSNAVAARGYSDWTPYDGC